RVTKANTRTTETRYISINSTEIALK
ncbi:MAG: hypothetical protein ACI87Q_002329, partial [Pseudohongiellaceae bacterium]